MTLSMPATTRWEPMVPLKRSKAVVDLGKKLVEQLDAQEDLVAAWIAHRIAEQIDAAEKASGEAKAKADHELKEQIFELWKRRSTWPRHLRPFDSLEPILRAISSLQIDGEDRRYVPRSLRGSDQPEEDGEAKRLLDLALGIDYTARVLIQWCLQLAAAT